MFGLSQDLARIQLISAYLAYQERSKTREIKKNENDRDFREKHQDIKIEKNEQSFRERIYVITDEKLMKETSNLRKIVLLRKLKVAIIDNSFYS